MLPQKVCLPGLHPCGVWPCQSVRHYLTSWRALFVRTLWHLHHGLAQHDPGCPPQTN